MPCLFFDGLADLYECYIENSSNQGSLTAEQNGPQRHEVSDCACFK